MAELVALVAKEGPVTLPLAACSVLALGVIIERWCCGSGPARQVSADATT